MWGFFHKQLNRRVSHEYCTRWKAIADRMRSERSPIPEKCNAPKDKRYLERGGKRWFDGGDCHRSKSFPNRKKEKNKHVHFSFFHGFFNHVVSELSFIGLEIVFLRCTDFPLQLKVSIPSSIVMSTWSIELTLNELKPFTLSATHHRPWLYNPWWVLASSKSPFPVSYTHLDVYKRQTLSHTICTVTYFSSKFLVFQCCVCVCVCVHPFKLTLLPLHTCGSVTHPYFKPSNQYYAI